MNDDTFSISEECILDDIYSFLIDRNDILKSGHYISVPNIERHNPCLSDYGVKLYNYIINIYGVSLVSFERFNNLTKICIKIYPSLIDFSFIKHCILLISLAQYNTLKIKLKIARDFLIYSDVNVVYSEIRNSNIRKYHFNKLLVKNKYDMSIWQVSDIFEFVRNRVYDDDYKCVSRYGKKFLLYFINFITNDNNCQNMLSSFILYQYDMKIMLNHTDFQCDGVNFFNNLNSNMESDLNINIVSLL